MKDTSGRMDVYRLSFPAYAHHTNSVVHGGIIKVGRGHHSQHHLSKTSLTTSWPEVHKSKPNEVPVYDPPNGVGGLRMFKRGRRDANDNANARDLREAKIMFMGIGGNLMTDLELLKREENCLLSQQMMLHPQKNYLQGSWHRGSGRPLAPEMANSSFESSKSSHGRGGAGNNVTP